MEVYSTGRVNIPGAKRHRDLLIGFSGIVSELLRYSSSGEAHEPTDRIETKRLGSVAEMKNVASSASSITSSNTVLLGLPMPYANGLKNGVVNNLTEGFL